MPPFYPLLFTAYLRYYLSLLTKQTCSMPVSKLRSIAEIGRFFLCLAAALFGLSNSATATEIRVALATDRPPYCFKNKEIDSGIELDLIRAALSPFGHTVIPVIVPKTRLALILKPGQADMSATIQGTDGDGLFFSDTYLNFHNYAISKKRKGIALTSLPDVGKYSFIIWQGGWANLGELFKETYKPDHAGKLRANYIEAHSQLNQSRMFWADRADLIIVDRKIFEHFRKLLRSEFNTDEEVTFHDVVKAQTNYQTAFRNRALRDQFNEGLKRIRADGSYQGILDSYK